jgi:hypothetical protein
MPNGHHPKYSASMAHPIRTTNAQNPNVVRRSITGHLMVFGLRQNPNPSSGAKVSHPDHQAPAKNVMTEVFANVRLPRRAIG